MQDDPSNPPIRLEEIETALGPQRSQDLEELTARAERFGGRIRLRRRSPSSWGRARFAFLVDLDPRGHYRRSFAAEPVVAHNRFEDAVQHVAELERRCGVESAS